MSNSSKLYLLLLSNLSKIVHRNILKLFVSLSVYANRLHSHTKNQDIPQLQSRPQPESYSHISKEIMSIKAQLLAVVNRLDYVEKNKREIMKK